MASKVKMGLFRTCSETPPAGTNSSTSRGRNSKNVHHHICSEVADRVRKYQAPQNPAEGEGGRSGVSEREEEYGGNPSETGPLG